MSKPWHYPSLVGGSSISTPTLQPLGIQGAWQAISARQMS